MLGNLSTASRNIMLFQVDEVATVEHQMFSRANFFASGGLDRIIIPNHKSFRELSKTFLPGHKKVSRGPARRFIFSRVGHCSTTK